MSAYVLFASSGSFFLSARSKASTCCQYFVYAFFASGFLSVGRTLLIVSIDARMLYACVRMLSRASHQVLESICG